MSIYRCGICDEYKDADKDGIEEFKELCICDMCNLITQENLDKWSEKGL